jgi:hypothetical protein
MSFHLVAGPIYWFRTGKPDINILLVRQTDMVNHTLNPGGTIYLKHLLPVKDPGREHDIRQTYRVIGMEVSDEQAGESVDSDTGRMRALHHSGSAIHKIGPVTDNHCYRRPGSVRVNIRCTGSEHYHSGARLFCLIDQS